MDVPSSLCSEHACFMWPRRNLLPQPSSLDSDAREGIRRADVVKGEQMLSIKTIYEDSKQGGR